MKTITAANSVFNLIILPIYPVPQTLQGYSADAAFETDAVEPSEVVMGVDGIMSAGYVPVVTKQTIHLMPDSPSSDLFENWILAQKVAREIYYANAFISLPSIGRKYVLTQGVLSSVAQLPSARKVLQARAFVITWASVLPSPF